MTKKFLIALFAMTYMFTNAQTAQELFGKWQLVKWVKNGKEKNIQSYFKTDQVYQIFHDDQTFESVEGDNIHKGKWHFSNDNKILTITTMLIPIKFQVDYFDKDKRVITYKGVGTFTYLKVKESEKIK